MFSFQLSVMRVVTVVRLVLQLVLVSADPQEPQDDLQEVECVRSVRNSSLLVISPSVLSSVQAGAGSHCHHCFTLLDNDQPILQVRHSYHHHHHHHHHHPCSRAAGLLAMAAIKTVSSVN